MRGKKIRRKQRYGVGLGLEIARGNRQQRCVSSIGGDCILFSKVRKKIECISVDVAERWIRKLNRTLDVTGFQQLSRQTQSLARSFGSIERISLTSVRS